MLSCVYVSDGDSREKQMIRTLPDAQPIDILSPILSPDIDTAEQEDRYTGGSHSTF